jgi:methylglutaconyl-CoA hydratase
MDNEILYTVKDAAAWITINQAEKMNRLTFDGIVRLVANVRKADEDDGVKVLVITGAGDKAFCAGASIDQIDMEYNKAVSYLRDMAVILSNTPDCIEGTRAFMEKRKPNPNSQE